LWFDSSPCTCYEEREDLGFAASAYFCDYCLKEMAKEKRRKEKESKVKQRKDSVDKMILSGWRDK
jgi:hypothetical protein